MKYLKIAILFSLINAIFFGSFLAVLSRQNLKLDVGSTTTTFESAAQPAASSTDGSPATSTPPTETAKPAAVPESQPKPKTPPATQTPVPAQPTSSNRCIITIKGQRYDVTDFRAQHPGGDIFVCGTDMTQVFFSQHDQALLDGPIMSQMRVP